MGGTGEKVSFKRFRATKGNAQERDQLKQDIIRQIDNSVETITVIALVEEPGRAGGGG
jgi:hypothetical protein